MVYSPKKMAVSIFAFVIAGAVMATVAIQYPKYQAEQRRAQIETLTEQCKEAVANQDWKTLEESAQAWTNLDQTSADAWLNLAEAFQKQGNAERCVDSLLSVPKRDPKSREAQLFASDMLLGEARQPARGIETLAALRRIAPQAEIVRKKLISLYAMTLQREKMIEEIRDAMQCHSEPLEAYVYLMIADHLSFTNGFQLNSQWLAAEPDSELFAVARAVQLSDTLRRLEKKEPETELQLEAAREEVRTLHKKFPRNRALLNHLLANAVETEDLNLVETLLKQLTDSDEEDSLTLRYRGWLAMANGKADEALSAYTASLALMPVDWKSWHELAGVLRAQAKLDEAEAAAKVANMGKELRKECLALPDASQVSPDLLQRLTNYARACGAKDVETAARFRLSTAVPM
jgi:tetratricopeptide (TPR) repeat protein